MSIETPLTGLLGIRHPMLQAPMDVIAGARLMAAVSSAGGFGILGGGYGERGWLEAGDGKTQAAIRAVRHRLHHLESRQAA